MTHAFCCETFRRKTLNIGWVHLAIKDNLRYTCEIDVEEAKNFYIFDEEEKIILSDVPLF